MDVSWSLSQNGERLRKQNNRDERYRIGIDDLRRLRSFALRGTVKLCTAICFKRVRVATGLRKGGNFIKRSWEGVSRLARSSRK